MKWIDRLPWVWVLVIGAWLSVAPVLPEPHLIEKLRMLGKGALTQPLDIFDLALHSAPVLLVLIKSIRWLNHRNKESAE
ncbi:MAG: hypothetical protein CFE44_03590 [Burkholderiales bacterium PBB4]|nr:MAG: hypothetical protein CFE44_03590 [Burkholderiales bacterium PBB4]